MSKEHLKMDKNNQGILLAGLKKAIFIKQKDCIWLSKFIKIVLSCPHVFIVVEVFFPQGLTVHVTKSSVFRIQVTDYFF